MMSMKPSAKIVKCMTLGQKLIVILNLILEDTPMYIWEKNLTHGYDVLESFNLNCEIYDLLG